VSYPTGNNLIEFELGCGHRIVCGRGVTNEHLARTCHQCLEKEWHDANHSVGNYDPDGDCYYCQALKILSGEKVSWGHGAVEEVRRVYPDFGKDKS
jgi:hypothetical protein